MYQLTDTVTKSADPDVVKTTVYVALNGATPPTAIDATAGAASFNAAVTDAYSTFYIYTNKAGKESGPSPASAGLVSSLIAAPAAPTTAPVVAVTGETPDAPTS